MGNGGTQKVWEEWRDGDYNTKIEISSFVLDTIVCDKDPVGILNAYLESLVNVLREGLHNLDNFGRLIPKKLNKYVIKYILEKRFELICHS